MLENAQSRKKKDAMYAAQWSILRAIVPTKRTVIPKEPSDLEVGVVVAAMTGAIAVTVRVTSRESAPVVVAVALETPGATMEETRAAMSVELLTIWPEIVTSHATEELCPNAENATSLVTLLATVPFLPKSWLRT